MAASKTAAIGRRSIPGLDKQMSVVATGFENFKTFDEVAKLLDAFTERGGNLFDTGYVYGRGMTETLFGQWHKARGNRKDVVVIGKGAHSPECTPEAIGRQLKITLDRLQSDYVDIYFMHRDNRQVPVGEFVDAINEQVKAGRIRGPFGGSNWTRARMDEAIAYARKKKKAGPTVLSNNFALAKMLKPIWKGTVSAGTPDWRKWLVERQMPNFSWSSQGRGFFTDRAGRDKLDDAELVRTWYSDANFARRERAIELGHQLKANPIHIALAYVLNQPFPSIPLIGPRKIKELDDSLKALKIKLTPEQLKWLENG